MIPCARCGSLVDETAQSACPRCATPLQSAVVMPPPADENSLYPPAPSVPVAASNRTGRMALLAAAVLLLLILLGAGGWALLYRRTATNPREQALRFFAAARDQDWKTLYELSEAASAHFPSEEAYESKMKDGLKDPFFSLFYTGMFIKPQLEIGQPIIHGDEATISVGRTVDMDGKAFNHVTDVRMKKINGVWKVADDPSSYGGMVAGNFEFKATGKLSGGGWTVIRQPDSSGQDSSSGDSSSMPNSAGATANAPESTAPSVQSPAGASQAQMGDATRLGSPPDTGSANGAGNNVEPPASNPGGATDRANSPGSAPPPQGGSAGGTGDSGSTGNSGGSPDTNGGNGGSPPSGGGGTGSGAGGNN